MGQKILTQSKKLTVNFGKMHTLKSVRKPDRFADNFVAFSYSSDMSSLSVPVIECLPI